MHVLQKYKQLPKLMPHTTFFYTNKQETFHLPLLNKNPQRKHGYPLPKNQHYSEQVIKLFLTLGLRIYK